MMLITVAFLLAIAGALEAYPYTVECFDLGWCVSGYCRSGKVAWFVKDYCHRTCSEYCPRNGTDPRMMSACNTKRMRQLNFIVWDLYNNKFAKEPTAFECEVDGSYKRTQFICKNWDCKTVCVNPITGKVEKELDGSQFSC